MSRYFQGDAVTGPVHASSARTFSDVVDVLRICPTLSLSKATFMALDKKRRNAAKQVPFFTPACFRQSPSKRTYENATHCNLLFLDIDELPDGTCPAAPFVNTPELLYPALDGYNFAAHTTASSTAEKPRMRIVVDASKIPLDDYSAAVATVGARLGLLKVTTESRVAVQPMFLPVMFADSQDADHPLIAFRLDGRPFTVEDITEESEKPKVAPTVPNFSGSGDTLDFLRAPVGEVTLAVAKEALENIDPDCVYHEWLDVAAALKHQFSPNKLEQAYALFDEWSSQGDKYGGEAETKAKWDSLRETPVGRAPVTIRSLLRMAAVGGWNDGKLRETSFANLVEWLGKAESITELLEIGSRKIAAMPLPSAVQEEVLIRQLCGQAKKKFAFTVSVSAIRRDIVRLRAEAKAQEKPVEQKREPVFARGVCYVSATQEFYRQRTGERYKADAFDKSYSRWLLPSEEALTEAGIPITAASLSKPLVTPTDYVLNHLKIPAVYDYIYDPSRPGEITPIIGGQKFVNTYVPTYPEPDPSRADEAGKQFYGHLQNLIAEEQYRRTLVDFIAYMVQHPGRKIRWAVVIQGVEGAGKTYLAEAAKAVLGRRHVKTISGEAIKKGWNEWSYGSQLIVLEEVRVQGTNRHEVMNALKPLITNDDISVNQRNRDTRESENIANYMLFSNHHDALSLTPGDRRYFVVKSALQHKQQVLALGENYFTRLFQMLQTRAGALRSWFLSWDISPGFSPDGHAPRTVYVTDMVNDSASDITAAVRRLLSEADYPLIQYDMVSTKTMLDVLQVNEGLPRVTAQQICHVLREEGFENAGRHMVGSERHYLWVRRGAPQCDFRVEAERRQRENAVNLCMETLWL